MQHHKRMIGVAAIGLMVGANGVLAADYTWIGSATDIWDQTSNHWGNAASTPLWDAVNGVTNKALFSTGPLNAFVSGDVYASNIIFTISGSDTKALNDNGNGRIFLSTGGEITANSGGTFNIYVPITGSNVTLSGTRYLYCKATNAFTGTLTITGNVMAKFREATSRPGPADIYVGKTSSETCSLELSSGAYDNNFYLTGKGGTLGRLLFYQNSADLNGPVTLLSQSKINIARGTVNFNRPISGDYALELNQPSVGFSTFVNLAVFGATNTFTGGLTIGACTAVKINNAGALNNSPGQENAITFTNQWNDLSGGVLRLNGYNVTVAGLTNAYSSTTWLPIVENSNSVSATLTVGNAQNLSGVFNGLLRDGTGNGKLALTKAGTGTLWLSNTNQYTGATTVSAGTLVITNAVTSTNWAVAADALLVVNGSVDLAGKMLMIAKGETGPRLSVAGDLTLGGTLTVTAGAPVTAKVKIAECIGTLHGTTGDIAATLPEGTLLEAAGKVLWLGPKNKGTMIRVF